jgi:adenosylhomocysteine nucleosidase
MLNLIDGRLLRASSDRNFSTHHDYHWAIESEILAFARATCMDHSLSLLHPGSKQNVETTVGRATGLGAFLIVVTGLEAEARIAATSGVTVFACGGKVGLQAHAIRRAVRSGAAGIVSFGIAGGLDPRLTAGDWVIATGVASGDRSIKTDIEWSHRLAQRIPGAELGDIATVVDPVWDPKHKRRLRLGTGAMAVDMESFHAAALAQELGVPFAAARVIADPVHREVPAAARLGLRTDGSVAVAPVLRSLLSNPTQLPSLLRVTRDAAIAFQALLRGRPELGPHFASASCPTVAANGPANSESDWEQARPLPA